MAPVMAPPFGSVMKLGEDSWPDEADQCLRVMFLYSDKILWYGVIIVGHNADQQQGLEESGDEDDIFTTAHATTLAPLPGYWEVDPEWPR